MPTTTRASHLESILTAWMLCAELARVIEQSRSLVEQSRRIALSAYPRIHPISGGSDAEMITTVLGGAALCRVGPARCQACLGVKTTTYRLATTNGAVRQPVAQQDGLWQFLEQHRGQMFCTRCLAAALGATRRIDRVVIAAEGRGALRRHRKCSACGKDRLVCGLSSA